jgi:HEAT repeat protein
MQLLASSSEPERLAAARYARGPKARARLRVLLRSDPAPAVRAAAVTRLVELDRVGALADAARVLEDPAPEVRSAAVDALARLDPDAIPELQHVIETGSPLAARAAVATLSAMGPEAHLLLADYADGHPDPAIRALARIAVGAPIGHRD